MIGRLALVFAVLAVAFAPFFFRPPGAGPEPEARAEIIFGGDMMFDRYIRHVAGIVGGDFIFSCIYPTVREADLVVANLEGPITTNASAGGNNLRFTFPPETAALLARHGISLVSLGNNHALDFGSEGVRSTIASLDEAGVEWFGDPLDRHVATTSVNGIPLAFISYNQFFTQDSTDMIYHITSEIREARAEGYLPIVYAHWGDEYSPATERQRILARRLVDAGAELVVGSHPHIIQEHETYAGKHIYYSLGNFIFDQYFDDEVRQGLLLRVLVSPGGVTGVEEIPIALETDGRTCYRGTWEKSPQTSRSLLMTSL